MPTEREFTIPNAIEHLDNGKLRRKVDLRIWTIDNMIIRTKVVSEGVITTHTTPES